MKKMKPKTLVRVMASVLALGFAFGAIYYDKELTKESLVYVSNELLMPNQK